MSPPVLHADSAAVAAGGVGGGVGGTSVGVDFKTDHGWAQTLDVYLRQVQLYAHMVARATGEPARSVLMRV